MKSIGRLASGLMFGGGLMALFNSLHVQTVPGEVQSVSAGNLIMSSAVAREFTTNDLWLKMVSVTNGTANLAIHPPWNATNGIYGVYFTPNPAIQKNWTRLQVSNAGQTNCVVSNLPPTQGFFTLADPTAIRTGFDANVLDLLFADYSSDLTPMGFTINFFGLTCSNLYVNENGNATFVGPASDQTPVPLGDFDTFVIAPFFADVDVLGTDSGVITFGTNTLNGHAAFGTTWSNVGYCYRENDKRDTFQFVLIERSDRADGDFDLEFNYAQIQWEAGYFSGGIDGLWTGWDLFTETYDGKGCSARAGFAGDYRSAGEVGAAFEMNGSGVASTFLDSNSTNGLIHNSFNSIVPGRYVFQFHNGVPLATP